MRNFNKFIESIKVLRLLVFSIVEELGIRHQTYSSYNLPLYARTNGRVQEFIFKLLCKDNSHNYQKCFEKVIDSSMDLYHSSLIDKPITQIELIELVSHYRSSGYVSLPFRLTPNLLTEIRNECYQLPCNAINLGSSKSFKSVSSVPDNYGSKLITDDLLTTQIPTMTKLLSSDFFYLLSKLLMSSKKAYLGVCQFWLSNPLNTPDTYAAQNWHWDCDGIAWVKYFLNLSDIDIDSGPHQAILSTHTPGAKSQELLDLGFCGCGGVEITLDMIKPTLENHSEQKLVTFCSEKGSILAGDTRCWHRGMPPTSKKRELIELVYFGHTAGMEKIL